MTWGKRKTLAAVLAAVLLGAGIVGYAAAVSRIESVFAEASASPSRLLSRPFVLYEGLDPLRDGVAEHLERAGYRLVAGSDLGQGEYSIRPGVWTIGVRSFPTAGGRQPARTVVMRLDAEGRITSLLDPSAGRLQMAHIEPSEIGAFLASDARDRIPVSPAGVSRRLLDAILVTEDRRFFEHGGFDLRRVAGAMLANLRAGRIVQGGSTITQQLVKSLFLSRERTFGRKLRELGIAWVLEHRYTKAEILEAYLNEIYLGQAGGTAIHGVGLAARHYFGREIKELSLAESALLAGIIRSPSSHSPLLYPAAARVRRDQVLDDLLEQGLIDESEHRAAQHAPLSVRPESLEIASSGYFADFVRHRLTRELSSDALERGGLRIFSTLDPRLQVTAERSVRRQLAALESGLRAPRGAKAPPLQAAIMVIEPRTGQVLAHVGGRDYATSPFDRATSARRQPGSVFKPVVALAALSREDEGKGAPAFTLASILPDEPFSIRLPLHRWRPVNHDHRFRGPVTLREALERSLNVPMARLGEDLGLSRVISTARRLGITSPMEPVPSLPLGAFEVTLFEMTRAYGVLAAGGIRAPVRFVLTVRTPDDDEVELPTGTTLRVFTPQETYLVTSALQGGVDRGTSTTLRDLGYRGAVAGKTGSTNRFRDAWFLAYTPEIVVGTWVGYDFNRSLGLSGSAAALPIVADVLIQVIGSRGGRHFRAPPGVGRATVSIFRGEQCHRLVEWFAVGTVPEDECEAPGGSSLTGHRRPTS